MYVKGVQELVSNPERLSLNAGGFEKLLELHDDSAGCLSLSCLLLPAWSQGQEQGGTESAGSGLVQQKAPEPELEPGAGKMQCMDSESLTQIMQGPMEVCFSGALDGIACQVLVERKAVRCRMRAVAAPVRSRLERMRGRLRRGLEQKGMSLEGFQVTS